MDVEAHLSSLIDDADFMALDARTGTFNLFEAMGAVNSELRHSNFLAYLLSPGENHGLGSEPLLRFLRGILSHVPPGQRPVRALELILGDLDDAIVHRERDNIDLLIEVGSLRLVVMIENKIGAKASEGQLARYKQTIRQRYPKDRHILVFLTPDGVDPEEEGYAAFDYSEVAEIVDTLTESKSAIAAETRLILRHYVEMLRRHIVPDEEMRALARRLYERHKEAFEFVFASRPEPDSLIGAAKALLQGDDNLVSDRETKTIVRFTLRSWLEIPELNACPSTAWTHTGRSLLWEIKNPVEDRVSVALIIGPAEAELRTRIYNAALALPKIFQGIVKPMGRQWATIFTRDLISPNSVRDMNQEEKTAVLKQRWNDFRGTDLLELEKAVLTLVEGIR